MRKAYKFRIYPTKPQERILSSQLEVCRKLYNHFLHNRKESYESSQKSLGLYDQLNTLKQMKIEDPVLTTVFSQVLQNVGVRVDLAYQDFFRRVKTKKPNEFAGFPRFKGFGRYDSMTFPQYGKGIKLVETKLRLFGLGMVKIKLHRPTEGVIKTATVLRSSTGKWYVSFSCEVEQSSPLPNLNNSVGIDLGVKTFATLSDTTKIENPRFFREEQKALAKANRKLAKFPKPTRSSPSSPFRLKAKKTLARVHERTKFKRTNFVHQESRKLINNYQLIILEDLNINKMKEKPSPQSTNPAQSSQFKSLRRSIADVAWNEFSSLLSYKAEEAGRTVLFVNPAYTSQDCSSCGHRDKEKKSLSTRTHKCKQCGLVMCRDLNASLNILRIGLDSLGKENFGSPESLEAYAL